MTNGASSLEEIEQRWPRVPVAGKTEPLEDGEAALESAIARLAARSEELRATLRALEEPQPKQEEAILEPVEESAPDAGLGGDETTQHHEGEQLPDRVRVPSGTTRGLTLVSAIPVPAHGEQDAGVAESTRRLQKANGHSGGKQVERTGHGGTQIGTLTSSAAALAEREQALAEREAELARAEELLESRGEHLEHRANVLVEDEQDLQERICQLDKREVALDDRHARANADLELRLVQIEERESELEELAAHLDQRDRDLRAYVAAVQRMMSQGTDPSASASRTGTLQP